MYVCICHAVSDKKLSKAVQEQGVDSVRAAKQCLGVGGTCGKCVPEVHRVIERNLNELSQLGTIIAIQAA